MACASIRLHWREDNVRRSILGSVARSLLMEAAHYLVETPLAAIGALWIICLPLLYFGLYADLGKSVDVMASMTVTFVMFLMTFLAIVVSACLLVSYVSHALLEARWHKVDSSR
jgi:hypothetical protein